MWRGRAASVHNCRCTYVLAPQMTSDTDVAAVYHARSLPGQAQIREPYLSRRSSTRDHNTGDHDIRQRPQKRHGRKRTRSGRPSVMAPIRSPGRHGRGSVHAKACPMHGSKFTEPTDVCASRERSQPAVHVQPRLAGTGRRGQGRPVELCRAESSTCMAAKHMPPTSIRARM
jgi:hypothetical protein